MEELGKLLLHLYSQNRTARTLACAASESPQGRESIFNASLDVQRAPARMAKRAFLRPAADIYILW